jgi:hypothetical protein
VRSISEVMHGRRGKAQYDAIACHHSQAKVVS